MAQAVFTVLVLIVFIAYAVFFALWNPEMVRVVGLNLGRDMYTNMPLWMLPLAGLAIGAIVMAIAMWSPWAFLKRALQATREQLETERERSSDRAAKLKALRERAIKLEAKLERQAEPRPAEEATAEGREEGV
ncbi:MAG: hypothetical protein ACP5KN_10330 [Armatimonadota bacterium]